MKRTNSPAAFTLLELMVVIILIGIVTGLVVPSLHGSTGTVRLEAAARQMSDLMDYCYQSAVTSGRTHVLLIDAGGRKLRIAAESDGGSIEGNEKPQAEEEHASGQWASVAFPFAEAGRLPEGVALTEISAAEEDLLAQGEEGIRILFFPEGTTEFATLVLSDAGGDRREVYLNGLSGATRIVRPSREDLESAQDGEMREGEAR